MAQFGFKKERHYTNELVRENSKADYVERYME